MDNQHKKITGYRDFTQEELDAINEIKNKSEEVGQLLIKISSMSDTDQRWLSIAKTDLQKGFMAFVRAVAKPTTF